MTRPLILLCDDTLFRTRAFWRRMRPWCSPWLWLALFFLYMMVRAWTLSNFAN